MAGTTQRLLDRCLVLHTVPSTLAFSPLGQKISPALAGVGAPGHVALTFDDGPDPVSTPEFLRVLDELGWHATFFMLGEMVRRAPSLAAEVAAAGHEVGVHADVHRSQKRMMPKAIRDDVARARAAVADATGVEPEWYRPPHGALSLEGKITARRLGMRSVLWTTWGRDWRAEATPESVRDDVFAGRVDGGTVLLHDSDCTSDPGAWRSALGGLPLLATGFAERDLLVGPVGEHGLGGERGY
jgi:peptidoglycan/xylan/chitin deacetylase (PgdA/CDA1 family)